MERQQRPVQTLVHLETAAVAEHKPSIRALSKE